MVTIKDVASRAQVSVSTVSYVMGGDPRISEETRERVMRAAKELKYSGNSGKRKKESKDKVVGIYLHSLEGKFYSLLIEALQKVFEAHGYDLYIHIGEDINYHDWLSGMIFMNSAIRDNVIQSFADKGMPVVLMDREITDKNIQNVVIDNYNGQYELTKKIIDMGARRMVYVGGVTGSYDSDMRYEGYRQALLDAGKSLSDMIFVRGDFTYKSGVEAATFILNTRETPDAFICANDEMCMGVTDYLKNRGIAVPGDVIVSGFDGIVMESPNYSECLTAYTEHHSWGNTAAYSLIEMMDHNAKSPEKIVLPVKFNIPGDS